MAQACPTGSAAVTPATMVGMPAADTYRKLSFWHDTVPGSLEPGDPLSGDLEADVAIAGAGYTGLWTAYYLSQANPGLTIAVCERDIAGFGASGRNGGWCSALFPASLAKLERMAGRDAAIAQHVPIDVMPLHYEVGHEVMVDRVVAPSWKREGDPFTVETYLTSVNPGRIKAGN